MGRAALVLLAFLLAGCDQPPERMREIHHEAKMRIQYDAYAAYDYVYVPRGQYAVGNCAKFAFTVWTEMRKAGFDPVMQSCTVKATGVRHVFVRHGKWASDVRFSDVTTLDRLGCI